eukprot:TRINITY_DN52_c0_g1_i1.p1 TRINITY_DN52_c0_g1~~TRINITY_DN52_c0_g1_i1.p1  ORF type:complete len:436 (-),score=131.09 TRINITY_DN52_c0_g1_i1:171-1478(-)
MKNYLLLSLVVIFFFASCYVEAHSASGDRVLVVLKDSSLKSTHSRFFKSLQARGFKLTFGTSKDSSLVLSKYGEFLYDHLVLFVSGVDDFAPKISVASVVEFIDEGKNVLLATDTEVGDAVRNLGEELGVEFDEEETNVIDHFNYHPSDTLDHTLLVATPAKNVTLFAGVQPVLFRGVGHTLSNENNGLNIPFLHGASTAYSFFLDKPVGKRAPKILGSKSQLVSALQARNNARAVISGSLELFSDKFFSTDAVLAGKKSKSGNEQFAQIVSGWVFQEKGVLKVDRVYHAHAATGETPSFYTIKDEVTYSIRILEWNGEKWAPFSANDVQYEFTRLDPYVRLYLTPDSEGNFNTTYILPDVYGVFSMIVDYARPGYTFISTKDVIPVRPFRHNQYERFIIAAYPYYASSFSMLVGIFVFSLYFLYTREDPKKKKD